MAAVPSLLWSAWFQGWEGAPPLVRACLGSWRSCSPDYEFTIVGERAIGALAPELGRGALAELPPALKSDLLRLHLLRDHGGVWVDATCFGLLPLSEWMPNDLEFVAFANPGRDRLLATWCLASRPGGYLVSRWYEELARYVTCARFRSGRWRHVGVLLDRVLGWDVRTAGLWLRPGFIRAVKLRPYYAAHYMFAELCKQDPQFAERWGCAGKMPASGPHALSGKRAAVQWWPRAVAAIDRRDVPLYKLNRRIAPRSGSTLEYLLATWA